MPQRELPSQVQVLSRFGLEGAAFALRPAAHAPPPTGCLLSLGLPHQGLLVLLLGCDVPVPREHGGRTEQSHW